MTTPVKDDDWGSATLYAGGRPFEPPSFGEGNPMGAALLDWGDREDEDADHTQWGTTTYVGRAARTRKRPSPRPTPTPPADDTIGSAAAPAVEDAEASNRGLLANSGSMAVASLASRITGVVRTILLLAALGVGTVGIAYNSGNNLPNMVYELLLGGVLSSVLIPLLVHAQAQDDDEGVAYTQRLLSIATAALGVMTLLATLAAPWIAAAFAPAGPRRELTSIFATLLLPEIFFYGLGAMFIAVLNIRHVYKPGAWSPVLNNVIMIVTVAGLLR